MQNLFCSYVMTVLRVGRLETTSRILKNIGNLVEDVLVKNNASIRKRFYISRGSPSEPNSWTAGNWSSMP
jgi:hypothetical protein